MRQTRNASPGLTLALIGLAGCGGDNSPSNVTSPGTPPSAETRVLTGGTAVLQEKPPVAALDAYVNGFHFYNGDLGAQMEAHHYCSVVNEDLRQCVIFDGNGRDAKLMGVEYIVSRRLFQGLPSEERRLWHSHDYEVKSGTLVAPGVPESAEHEFMEQMVGTYGKTWHTWHTDRELSLPVGHPALMAGFTADGQLDPGLLAERDRRFGISTDDKRRAREDIVAPAVLEGANAWQHGEVLQLTLERTNGEAPPHGHAPPAQEAREPPPATGADGPQPDPAPAIRKQSVPSRSLRTRRGPTLYAHERH
jgi:hypothetical protein